MESLNLSSIIFLVLFGGIHTTIESPNGYLQQLPDTNRIEPRWEWIPDLDKKMMRRIDLNKYEYRSNKYQRYNAAKAVKFKLFTQNNSEIGQDLNLDVNIGTTTSFNPNHQTRIIIHGWTNDGSSSVNRMITKSYLDRGDFNIIVVDWGKIAKNPNYVAVRYRLNNVADVIAKFIDFLASNRLIDLNDLSIIGHSLGAHLAGLAGKKITNGKVQTIIALDPARPLFSLKDPSNRLSVTDANYVEVHHTNAGMNGFYEPLGNSDFYANGGVHQEDCGIDLMGSCSHSKAFAYFAESLQETDPFVAQICQSLEEAIQSKCRSTKIIYTMGGEPPNRDIAGIFKVSTNSPSPSGVRFGLKIQ